MKIISKNETSRIPIVSWCNEIEDGAIEQAVNLSNLPFAFKHVAIMPDCHQGYGMPIGGVLATKNAIIPNAVGVDIGCGMIAVKTSLTDMTQDNIKQLFGGSKDYKGGIRANIPVGFSHNKDASEKMFFENSDWDNCEICLSQKNSARKQIGTLGGGNHFIEIQKGNDSRIWFMVHSGSRNLGYKVANHYNKLAQNLNKMWHSNIPEFKGDDGLAFLPIGTKEARDYLKEMKLCLDFAYENRIYISEKIKLEFHKIFPDIMFTKPINIHHNYACIENHFGENVWVHRKGATSAKKGEIGIIPGSQGSKSYIVEGLGNADSFMSCSHGAGRKMSRKKAKNELILSEQQKIMEGIVHGLRNTANLDEAPDAYKNIDTVMESQMDLVKTLVELKPLGVIKG
jgi:tRNA-splicing ligase RtcB